MKINLIIIGLVSLFGLSGCFNGSSNSNNGNGIVVSAEKAGVQAYSSKDWTDEAVQIDVAADLRSDITAVFGDTDGEPIPVEDGETVQDVLDKI